MEIGSSQRHDEVSQPDEGRVRVGEQADDDVAVEHRHGRLVAIQYAVFEIAGGAPVEHARRVVLHLRLLEVEVLGLVVGDADLQAAVVVHVRAAGRAIRRPVVTRPPFHGVYGGGGGQSFSLLINHSNSRTEGGWLYR